MQLLEHFVEDLLDAELPVRAEIGSPGLHAAEHAARLVGEQRDRLAAARVDAENAAHRYRPANVSRRRTQGSSAKAGSDRKTV